MVRILLYIVPLLYPHERIPLFLLQHSPKILHPFGYQNNDNDIQQVKESGEYVPNCAPYPYIKVVRQPSISPPFCTTEASHAFEIPPLFRNYSIVFNNLYASSLVVACSNSFLNDSSISLRESI